MSDKKIFPKDKKYCAVLIGAGRIAATFDSIRSKNVLTHAHAYYLHPQVDLVGIYDIDFSKATEAAQKWKSTSYGDLDVMFKDIEPDIVSVCAPDDQHVSLLEHILPYQPKIVICEKPITTRIRDTKNIIAKYKKNKIPLLVNYSRRFDRTVQVLKKELATGKHGKVVAATGVYSKGTLHNGSHMIDLCLYLFGQIQQVQPLWSINDYTRQDVSVSGFLQFARCPQFHLVATDQRHFTMFEMDIVCEKTRFRFIDEGFGLMVQSVVPDTMFPGYTMLGTPQHHGTQLNTAMYQLVQNAVEHLNNGAPLVCTAEDALEAQKICIRLLKKYV